MAHTIAFDRGRLAGEMSHAAVKRMARLPVGGRLDQRPLRIRPAAVRPPGHRRVGGDNQGEYRAEKTGEWRTVQDEPPVRTLEAGGAITRLASATVTSPIPRPGRERHPLALVIFLPTDTSIGQVAMIRSTLMLFTLAVLPAGRREAPHTHLVKAEPAIDTTVATAPTAVRLWFNTRPEAALSGATILMADNSPVAVVKLAATEDTLSVAGAIPVKLAPGQYTVAWKTGARDGHVVRGKYTFTYAPAPAHTP